MTIRFTDEEREWLVMEPFNWHIREGCPKNIRKGLAKKLELLSNNPYDIADLKHRQRN